MERRDDLFSLKHFSHLAARLSRGNGAIRLARGNFLFVKYISLIPPPRYASTPVDASRHTETGVKRLRSPPLLNVLVSCNYVYTSRARLPIVLKVRYLPRKLSVQRKQNSCAPHDFAVSFETTVPCVGSKFLQEIIMPMKKSSIFFIRRAIKWSTLYVINCSKKR